jgi:transposase
VVWQGKCASTPEAMAATVQRRAPHVVRIALETGPMSAWHYRRLTSLGLPVVCIDARHAKAALAMQLNKTDANDALGLAQIVRTGWYREVAVKSEHSHRTRGLLAARAKLVGMRKEVANQLRGLLKVFGYVIGPASGRGPAGGTGARTYRGSGRRGPVAAPAGTGSPWPSPNSAISKQLSAPQMQAATAMNSTSARS